MFYKNSLKYIEAFCCSFVLPLCLLTYVELNYFNHFILGFFTCWPMHQFIYFQRNMLKKVMRKFDIAFLTSCITDFIMHRRRQQPFWTLGPNSLNVSLDVARFTTYRGLLYIVQFTLKDTFRKINFSRLQ